MGFAQQVRAVLSPAGRPDLAVGMAAYMKGQFVFLGVQTPQRRALTRPLIRAFAGDAHALIDAAQALWRLPEREYQYTACDLLWHHRLTLQASDLPAVEQLAQSKSWWDTVDPLAKVIGHIVYRHRKLARRMDELIAHDNFWLRRVALLHQLDWKADTDEVRLFNYCTAQAGEREFFIRKAIGWALRQHARTRPQAVRMFLKQHGKTLSALSVREAAKHL